MADEAIALEDRESELLPCGADVHAPALVAIGDALGTRPGESVRCRATTLGQACPLPFLHRPFLSGLQHDPDLASYLRIEERELEAGGQMPDDAAGREAERADDDLHPDELQRDIRHGGDDPGQRHGERQQPVAEAVAHEVAAVTCPRA